MLALLVLVPLVGIILLNLPFRDFMRRISFWFAAGIFLFEVAVAVAYHPVFYNNDVEGIKAVLNIQFTSDSLDFLMFLCVGIVCLASLCVGFYTLSDQRQRFNFINLLIITSIGLNGIVLSHDIFSLYVFLEITAVASFILIAFRRGKFALEGAFKYIMLSSVATILLLFSIALFFLLSGGTSYSVIHETARHSQGSHVFMFAVAIFFCGLFIKGGLVPFHGWLPDAYVGAPSPVAVLLAGIVTKICGIYTLIRFSASVFGLNNSLNQVILLVGLVSVFFGALAALGQKDLKRMLAYSSISQIGYILLGLGTGSALGLAGAVFHFFNHAMFKSLLFVNAAAIRIRLGTYDMDEMGGLSSRMPVTGLTSIMGFLSAAGVPPLAGFWSKFMIIIALWQAGHLSYAVLALLASVLTLAYLLMMQRKIFFGKLNEQWKARDDVKEVPVGFSLVAVALAFIVVASGLMFPYVLIGLIEPVKEILLP